MSEDNIILFPDLVKNLNGSAVNQDMAMFLDVATSYTGYSLFEYSHVEPKGFYLVGYGIFKAKRKNAWETRCFEIASKVGNIIHTVKPWFLVQEYPYFQAGTKGMAASRSGGTLELAYLCGMIANRWDYYITKVLVDSGRKVLMDRSQLITYNQWNGQLQKKHTCRRCLDHFDVDAKSNSIDNNFADAIMMGKFFIEDRMNQPVKGQLHAERVDL